MPLNCHIMTCEMAAFKHIAKGLHLCKVGQAVKKLSFSLLCQMCCIATVLIILWFSTAELYRMVARWVQKQSCEN